MDQKGTQKTRESERSFEPDRKKEQSLGRHRDFEQLRSFVMLGTTKLIDGCKEGEGVTWMDPYTTEVFTHTC